jgi:hypothetical protein
MFRAIEKGACLEGWLRVVEQGRAVFCGEG